MATTSPQPWAFLLAGDGARAWTGCVAHPGHAWGLPADRVRERRTWTLPADEPADALAWWQRWHGAGLGVAGWLGYDWGAALEGLAPAPRVHGLPDADLVAFDPADLVHIPLPTLRPPPPLDLPPSFLAQEPAFLDAVAQALDAIRAGEIYQVNLSVAFDVDLPRATRDPVLQLATVLGAQSVPLAAVWCAPTYTLLSGSMERFLHVRGAEVSTRPIKGTAPRRSGDADLAEAAHLAASDKERAENTMIVDMARNDLQRACHFGSVRVEALCTPTPYQTLWHLESEVVGTLRDPSDRHALLAATMPPASVTGCPKIQATRVIRRLEGRHRGPYCGALGIDVPGEALDLSVGIRQVWLQGTQATLSVGAGVVAQSTPAREWQELCTKAQSGLRALAGLQALAGTEAHT